ncbi:hypothetical protein [Nakamurella aerolata]|uniref:DNA-binding protein n=1 Tax=Nakamurella aerolata TaxID=1656892 RepID=A0A849A3M8_9ACTN|nr:hypothetical protein [Nakamurella aerolata]NNG35634.1 hypothetical protein [Nakamurella aerolata]
MRKLSYPRRALTAAAATITLLTGAAVVPAAAAPTASARASGAAVLPAPATGAAPAATRPAAVDAQAPARRPVTVAGARRLPLGTTVTVMATVSTPPGAFESSFYDKGFGLLDSAAGIYVSTSFAADVRVGQRVRVTGVLADQAGLRVIRQADAAAVRVLGGPGVLRVWPVPTGAVSEATEGLLVKVSGTVVGDPVDDLPYGYKVTVDDGSGPVLVFVNTQTGIDVGALHAGDRVAVTGFSSQYDTHYEVDPRSPADIVLLN